MKSDPSQQRAKAQKRAAAPSSTHLQTSLRVAPGRAELVEQSGNLRTLEQAACRLGTSERTERVLRVPEQDMELAMQAMRNVHVSGTVMNLAGTQSCGVGERPAVTPDER